MGDTAKQVRGRGLMDEDDFKRSPLKQSYLGHDFHGKKEERDSPKPKPIQVIYSSSPRNGLYYNTFKNFSPGGRSCSNHKDGSKRWQTEEQRSNSNNWRDRRSQTYHRSRNTSFNEPVDGSRWQEGGDRRHQVGRKQIYKSASSEDFPDAHTAVSDSFTQVKGNQNRHRHHSEHDQEESFESPVIDESMLSEKELLGLQQAEERLKRDCIYRLKRRPRKYPTAVYTCKLCDNLVDSISSAHKHIKEKRHKRYLKEKREEELLTTLPHPTQPQIQAIDVALTNVVQEHGLDEEDLARRIIVVTTMETLIQKKLPGCSLRLYGSSCSRMGFKNSDLNIDIQFPATMNRPDVLLFVQESLKQSDSFIEFDTDFHARVPVVVCREKQSGLLCKVSAGNENACLTTNLLTSLGRLESRLLPLVVAFRYWLKLCAIDRPEEGGLPPYVAALMVVFFLQQRKEPVLPTYLGTWVEGFSVSRLVQFHLLEPEKESVYWQQSALGEGEHVTKEECLAKGKVALIFAEDKQYPASVGQLWVDLLRFYALEFNMADLVITIRVKEKVSRESKDWPKKRIAIEDPYSVKRNVARSLTSQLVYEYMIHCLKSTYKYFAMPQRKSKTSNKKQLPVTGTSADCGGATSDAASEMARPLNAVQVLSKKLENLAVDAVTGASVVSRTYQNEANEEPDITIKRKLVYDVTYPDSVLEDADCITEEIIVGDPEDSFQSDDEPESGHEESDDDHLLSVKKESSQYILIDRGFDEDSESGEVAVAGNEETDSLSDFEGGGGIEGEDLGLEVRGIYDRKLDIDEESTEGTDELEETTHDFIIQEFDPAAVNHSDEDYDVNVLLLDHRQHLDSLTADEDLENTYTVSADDMLLEDDHVPTDVKDAEKRKLLKDADLEESSTTVEGLITEDASLFYVFNKPIFTRGKLPTVVCNLCKKEGHLKRDCPEDFKKIELEALPSLTPKFQQLLDQACIQCYEDFSPTSLEDKAREHIRQDLEDFIRRDFPGGRLNLFGSSKNGFGFKQSDLDICMTFDGLETAEELDSIRTIEELARHLRKHQGLRNILPITTAKVPIVKFYHVRSGLEGDISLYNTLALHNTQLLASYAAIDPRVKHLCYIMKVFTKMCDIGDASRGSLSSYAYTLMVLYFLQQRNPPVIPVLQEIYPDGRKPEILVDGWNVYFFSKLNELAKYWPDYDNNKESVGELWLGLLRFYTEEFDFKEHVICIRRKSLLTTFKKQWTSKYIVIEDPFDLNHNLGAGLSRKMTNFIMKAFINGRRVFGTPVKSFPKEYPSKMEYFFDPDVLTEGEVAPNDRCCRICGKIGHFMKDCPMRRKARRRNHENTINPRYPEKRQQRKMEDKEPTKNTEGEASLIEGKQVLTMPKNPHHGARGTHEMSRERTPRLAPEKWRRQDDRELREKRCFICGREGHIKKECPQYKGSAGNAITRGNETEDVLQPSVGQPFQQIHNSGKNLSEEGTTGNLRVEAHYQR